jgi:putative redox protein
MKYMFENPVAGTIGTEKYFCSIQWRNGKIIADEPASSGGGDLGPDPHSLLASSVASCALITMRMYIDRKNWDIPLIQVNVNMYQEQVQDKVTTIVDRDILFGEGTPEDQKIKLQEIANLCPISKILENDIKLRTFIFKTGETKTIKYANDQVTVLWKPEFCQHSTRCWKQLPQVFNPSIKKWINPDGAPAERISEQIKRCPSGALTFVSEHKESEKPV